MKRLLLIITFLIPVSGWSQAITLVAQTGCAASIANNPCTTSAVNGSGGNFIVAITSDSSNSATLLSDSNSNTYTQCGPTENNATNVNNLKIFYKANAVVSSSMTFTVTPNIASLPAGLFAIFSNVASSPCDQSIGNTANAVTTLSAGSITPTQNGELVISALGVGAAITSPAINGSFNFTGTANVDFISGVGSTHYGAAVGYLVQGTAAAVNPAWSWTTSDNPTALNVSFKGISTTGNVRSGLMLLGIGR